MEINAFMRAVLEQKADAIRTYFHPDAVICWHCSNERFTVEEFIRANCEYPGSWDGEMERMEQTENRIITVTNVYPTDRSLSFHVTSFFHLVNDKIITLDEYWAADAPAPAWRQEMHIGRPIREHFEGGM